MAGHVADAIWHHFAGAEPVEEAQREAAGDLGASAGVVSVPDRAAVPRDDATGRDAVSAASVAGPKRPHPAADPPQRRRGRRQSRHTPL
jgi:hypothetical protein